MIFFDEFTKAVGEHKETQRYMDDFAKTFKEELSNKYNGKYKPFKTVAVLEKEFSGTLERNKK